MDLYLKSSYENIFKILVSVAPYILMSQHPELFFNSSVQSGFHKLCKIWRRGNPKKITIKCANKYLFNLIYYIFSKLVPKVPSVLLSNVKLNTKNLNSAEIELKLDKPAKAVHLNEWQNNYS